MQPRAGAPNGDEPRQQQRPSEPRRRHEWRSHVDELIQEARRNGAFANLRGEGQPLRLDENIFAGDKALGYHLLASNHLAPPEIERGREIDAELARAEALLARLRRHRDALWPGPARHVASERRVYALLRGNTRQRYAELLRATNSNILSLNIIAPSALHRQPVDLAARLRAFDAEFPPVGE